MHVAKTWVMRRDLGMTFSIAEDDPARSLLCSVFMSNCSTILTRSTPLKSTHVTSEEQATAADWLILTSASLFPESRYDK